MGKDTTKSVLAFLNTPIQEVSSVLSRLGFNLKIVSNNKTEVENDDSVYGFINVSHMVSNLKNLKHPPLLWETIGVVHHLSLGYPVKYMDAKRMKDGVIIFNSLNAETLQKYLSKQFEPVSGFMVERQKPVQYGNNSAISQCLNAFLVTLPEFTLKATLVAFTEGVKNDISIFENFVATNRLVTNENGKEFSALSKEIKRILPFVKSVIIDKNPIGSIKDEEMKENIRRIKFLVTFFSKSSLAQELDPENNINLNEE